MSSRIKALKQRHSSGCGPTSIKMAADFFDAKISFKRIEDACGEWKEEGMSNEDLVRTLKHLGFKAAGSYDSSWKDLLEQNTDDRVIIVSWMLEGYIGHFSVVDRVTDKSIWLADPESGSIIKMERMVFLRLWFDYGENWYPETAADFKLRWMVVTHLI